MMKMYNETRRPLLQSYALPERFKYTRPMVPVLTKPASMPFVSEVPLGEVLSPLLETKGSNSFDLAIKALPTDKSKIKQRVLMKKKIIPRHPASVIFNGSSGSGKSTLLLNLLTRREFFKNYFDEVYLFSPTGGSDDLFKHAKIPEENIFMDIKEKDLADILKEQRTIIEDKGIEKAPKVLIIFEDIQSNGRFMRSKSFLKSFIANRHYGISTWLCGQSYTKTPRACRLQANNVFYFRGSGSELERISEEYCPPGLGKKEFAELVDKATRDKHSFLHINCHAGFDDRYRKNLDEILDVSKASREQSVGRYETAEANIE